jgi:ParB family chromosome partitioning protein
MKTNNEIQNLSLSSLHDFPNHPFQVNIDEELEQMAEDIKSNGVRQPIIVRPKENGEYEIIAGHRRKKASELAGLDNIPAIVKELSEEEAVIIMCSTNFHQRKNILPSEKAFAYKMQLDTMKHQGKTTSVELQHKSTSREELAKQLGVKENQIQSYIRLTYLIKPLLDLVDKNELNFNPAVSLSYLDPKTEQPLVLEQIEYFDKTPTVAQARELKELSEKQGLSEDDISRIMDNRDERMHEHFKIPTGAIKNCFPKDMKPKEIQEKVIEIVKLWHKHKVLKKQQRESEQER